MKKENAKRAGVRILSGVLCALILFFALRGGKKVDAGEVTRDFCEAFGRAATIYDSTAEEGEKEYCDASFFPTLFGEEPLSRNFAVAVFPSADAPGECGVIVCKTKTEARKTAEVCQGRIDLLSSFSYGDGARYPSESFLTVKGKTVIYGVLTDAQRAEKILTRLI